MALKDQTMTDTNKTAKRPMSPRRKRYLIAIGFSVAIGGIIGIWSRTVSPGAPDTAFLFLGNPALTASFAVGASLLWAIGMAIGIPLFHRAVDDHEERALLWSGLAAWYAFAFAAPVWWLLHRADLVPPVDAMLLFAGSTIVNVIVWLWFKFR